jgi:hypothetical protein
MVGAQDSSSGGHCLAAPCLAAKSSHIGADMDGLAYRLQRPTNCGWQAWVQSLLTDVVPSHCTASSDHLSGGVKPLGRATWRSVDCLGPWWIESLMERPAFARPCLSDVRVIMMIMRAPVVELLCQTAKRRILALKCQLSGAHGHIWPCPIVLGIKCHHLLRSQLWWCLPDTESP